MTERPICGCGATLGLRNTSGRCRSCTAKMINSRPGIAEARAAGIRTKFANDPEHKARAAARLKAIVTTPEGLARLRENGKKQHRDYLSRPDIVAKAQSVDARRKRGESYTNTKLGWCPPERRDDYRFLLMKKGVPAAEARAIIEAEIAGTVAAARREIADRELQMRLKHERDLASRY